MFFINTITQFYNLEKHMNFSTIPVKKFIKIKDWKKLKTNYS